MIAWSLAAPPVSQTMLARSLASWLIVRSLTVLPGRLVSQMVVVLPVSRGLPVLREPFVAEAVCGEAGLESDVGPVLDFGEVNEQVAYEFELCSFDVAFVGAGHVVFEGDGQVAAGPGE
jgi:hypothetical protein